VTEFTRQPVLDDVLK